MKRLELPENDIRPNLHYPLYETRIHKAIVGWRIGCFSR
jgi:hypothetical protein